jgi:hypothetical protein
MEAFRRGGMGEESRGFLSLQGHPGSDEAKTGKDPSARRPRTWGPCFGRGEHLAHPREWTTPADFDHRVEVFRAENSVT